MIVSVPWDDLNECGTDPSADGTMTFGDWSLIWSFNEDWEPCGAILKREDRDPVHVCDAICVCRPGHEHPHLAMNRPVVRRHERVLSVSRRRKLV